MKPSESFIGYLPKHSMSKRTIYGSSFGTVECEEVSNVVCLHLTKFKLTPTSLRYLHELLEVILDDLRGKYVSILEYMDADNVVAIKIAKRMGFIEVGREDGFVLLERGI